jgi:hypothetical protein
MKSAPHYSITTSDAVRARHGLVQLYSEAWAVRHTQRSMVKSLLRLYEVAAPCDFAPLEFQQSEILQHRTDAVVFAKPNASDASPKPVSPASVRSRTISHTVRAVARTGSFGAPWSRRDVESVSPAAAAALVLMNVLRFTL